MEIKNCKKCGRLFNYLSGKPICPDCKKAIEDKFQQVKEYIREHGRAGIAEVAEANEVDVKQIKQWVREERLIFSDEAAITIECENCGAPIRAGRFCQKCVGNMTNTLNSAIKKPVMPVKKQERDTKDRMRFLDR